MGLNDKAWIGLNVRAWWLVDPLALLCHYWMKPSFFFLNKWYYINLLTPNITSTNNNNNNNNALISYCASQDALQQRHYSFMVQEATWWTRRNQVTCKTMSLWLNHRNIFTSCSPSSLSSQFRKLEVRTRVLPVTPDPCEVRQVPGLDQFLMVWLHLLTLMSLPNRLA